MNIKLYRTTILLGGVAASFWLGLQGCAGSQGGAYCRKVCDCIGCAETVREDCENTMDDTEKKAEDQGCSEEYRSAIQCVIEDAKCVKDQLDTVGCEAELEAFSKCGGTTTVGKDACEAYADDLIAKLEECGVTVESGSGSSSAECTTAQAKLAVCYDGCLPYYDCVCFADATGEGCVDKIKLYSDCATACQ